MILLLLAVDAWVTIQKRHRPDLPVVQTLRKASRLHAIRVKLRLVPLFTFQIKHVVHQVPDLGNKLLFVVPFLSVIRIHSVDVPPKG